MNWTSLGNTLLIGAMTMLCACAMGWFAALAMLACGPRWRRWQWLAVVAPLMLPPFLVVDCWLRLLGVTGIWHHWFPLEIYSLAGTVWVLTLMYWPLTTLGVLASWSVLNRGQLEADPALTGRALWRWLLWPAARPGLALAAPLTFILAINNFSVPAILQVKVLPAEIWIQLNTRLDASLGWGLSWPLLVAPLLLVLAFRSRKISWPRPVMPATAAAIRRQMGGVTFGVAVGVTAALSAMSVGVPLLLAGLAALDWKELQSAYLAGQEALLQSFIFAMWGSGLATVLALLVARWHWTFVTWLFFLVPGVLLGMTLIPALNHERLGMLYRSGALVVIVLGIRYWALPLTTARHARSGVDEGLGDVIRVEGGSSWQVWRHAWWPQMAGPMTSAWYLSFILCLWDVESLLMIMPPGRETVAMRIFNLLHYGHTGQVKALCVLLLLIGLCPAAIWGAGRFLCDAWRRRGAWVLGALLAVIVAGAGCRPDSPRAGGAEAFFREARIIGGRGTALGQFNKPRSVAVDSQDNLYVVDMTGRVQKFSPKGEYLDFWQMPETDKGKPKGMGVDRLGNIMVLEPHYSRVTHFTSDGDQVAMWGRHGTANGDLAFPRALATSSRGDIFVSEYGLVERVQCFSAFGTNFVRQWGRAGTGAGEFNRPEGLGMDATDRLYVADSCNHRVQVFTADGVWLASFGKPGQGPDEMSYPYDVRIDSAGYEFVCEFGNSRIQIFDREHRSVGIFGRPGGRPGEFSNPWSIALDSRGNLYVADSGNHRVQKLIRSAPTRSGAVGFRDAVGAMDVKAGGGFSP